MNQPSLEALLDIEMPVTVRLSSAQVPLGDVLGMDAGSLVEFQNTAQEPVELLVNGRVVARGEMVMAQGSYGVRITEISSPYERLETGAGASPAAKGAL